MAQAVITICFYLLFFLTPLVFSAQTSELFEFNKMFLVYLMTILITTFWAVKIIQTKEFNLKKTSLDLPIGLFLLSQILSTISSIDPHTSIWGYYSRLNGGLVSIICYILLFYALVSNFTFEQSKNFLKTAIFGGLVVALYAIPEHFGLSPSCFILGTQRALEAGTLPTSSEIFNASCWVQDVQARVFATLGQPNWLAAYLAMLIFPALYFALTAKNKFHSIIYYLLTVIFYLAFTFTYSRGATLGFLAAMGVFLTSLVLKKGRLSTGSNITIITVITIITFIFINLIFGSALTRFQLSSLFPSSAPSSTLQPPSSIGTQLENGGTESGQIRFIVWQGALEIFKNKPLFGSGVETFAYSYYQFRPLAHNLVSEWDFLYNKAHNEYLNYLATTGIVGLLSYLFLIGTFLWWCLKQLRKSAQSLIITALMAAYISYLVQNFFQFSVVIIALFLFTFPAFAFLAAGDLKVWKLDKNNLFQRFFNFLTSYQTPVLIVIVLIGLFLVYSLSRFYLADILYKQGQDAAETNPSQAYTLLSAAVNLNSFEPLYRLEKGSAASTIALALSEEDPELAAQFIDQADQDTQQVLSSHPLNPSLWRSAILTYFTLSLMESDYEAKTLQASDQVIKLAPTDPKPFYNKAIILQSFNNDQEAINALEQAIKLKPDFDDALFLLAESYEQQNQFDQAQSTYQKILQAFPNEPRALQKLEQLATISAQKR